MKYIEKLEKIVDSLPIGVYITNLKGEILYVNSFLIRIFGFDSMDEMKKEGVLSRYKNKERRNVLIDKLKAQGIVNNFEFDGITKKGEIKHLLLNARLDKEIILGTVIDITSHKKRQKKLELAYLLSEEITEAPDLETALKNTLQKICEKTRWEYGEAWIPEPEDEFLIRLAAFYSDNRLK